MAAPDELVRVVRGADGGLLIGRGRPGRGAWLCAGSAACLEEAVRRRALGRALRAEVGTDAVASLRARLAGRASMEGSDRQDRLDRSDRKD